MIVKCKSVSSKNKASTISMFEFMFLMQIVSRNNAVTKRLRNWVRTVYGKFVRVDMVLEDVWKAELWFLEARKGQILRHDILDSCGACGNLHFLLILLYKYLGFLREDFVFLRAITKKC